MNHRQKYFYTALGAVIMLIGGRGYFFTTSNRTTGGRAW